MAVNVLVATGGHHNADAAGGVLNGVDNVTGLPTEDRGSQQRGDIETVVGPQLTILAAAQTVVTGVSIENRDGKHTVPSADISLSRQRACNQTKDNQCPEQRLRAGRERAAGHGH